MRGGAPRRRAGGQRRGMPALPVHRGSCLCARVRYEVSGRLGTFDTCHCTDCRKSHARLRRLHHGGAARFPFCAGSGPPDDACGAHRHEAVVLQEMRLDRHLLER